MPMSWRAMVIVGSMLWLLCVPIAQGQDSSQEKRYDGLELAGYAALWEQSRAQGGVTYGDDNARRIEYFTGFVNGVAGATVQKYWCPRGAYQFGQIWGVVAKYLREHPEHWHRPPAHLVTDVLAEAFPCSASGQGPRN